MTAHLSAEETPPASDRADAAAGAAVPARSTAGTTAQPTESRDLLAEPRDLLAAPRHQPTEPRGQSAEPRDLLADRLATAILGTALQGDADLRDLAQVGGHLALVRRCHTAEAVTKSLTQQAVDAARAAGHSWAEIGGELGMSRQAAQQRFGGAPEELEADERWLGPVTAFDELTELELAGRLGWHTVGAGTLRHRMVRTATQWEHRRLLWPQSTARLLKDGWQIGCRAFPWIYLIRDTGIPAEPE